MSYKWLQLCYVFHGFTNLVSNFCKKGFAFIRKEIGLKSVYLFITCSMLLRYIIKALSLSEHVSTRSVSVFIPRSTTSLTTCLTEKWWWRWLQQDLLGKHVPRSFTRHPVMCVSFIRWGPSKKKYYVVIAASWIHSSGPYYLISFRFRRSKPKWALI